MGVSENRVYNPQITPFNKVFHYKSSILGYPYFWKHPYFTCINPTARCWTWSDETSNRKGWTTRCWKFSLKLSCSPGFLPCTLRILQHLLGFFYEFPPVVLRSFQYEVYGISMNFFHLLVRCLEKNTKIFLPNVVKNGNESHVRIHKTSRNKHKLIMA